MTILLKGTDVNVYGQCSCLICGEAVPLLSPFERGQYKICDKCKEAVMHVREQLHIDASKLNGDWEVNSDPDKGPC